ncbi:hypothetical protein KC19_1G002100 [Ceratodon purpureus]|uniref:Uncharacterized protein n=1 Tax=Ceratodon purpureus TaxID=3225 RepID=A0A8T0J286_CERPU|nr:hypothetical protein KC19_1G002100 [Ceratodon purpureus]
MNKFNLPRRNIQKERRAKRAEKRKLRSSAATLKVSCAKKAPSGITGKKARKLQKRWRQAQKEALQSGLVTMHDIEMMAVDEEGGDEQASSQSKLPKTGRAFLMKKRAKLRLKTSSSKGKQVSDHIATSTDAEGADAMMQ